MKSPDIPVRRVLFALASVLLFSLPVAGQPTLQPIAAPIPACDRLSHDEQQLSSGQVVVDCRDVAGTKYVVGRIWIDESPEKCWRTMVNPFEFRQRICRRLKQVTVLSDEPAESVLKCTISAIFPIPDFQYVVDSRYVAGRRIDFQRISGSFREFRGFWELEPVGNGTKSEVTYSLYIDPGFPAPDWLVRMAVRGELPNVLTGLRDRIDYLKHNEDAAEKITVKAAALDVAPTASTSPAPAVLVPVSFKN